MTCPGLRGLFRFERGTAAADPLSVALRSKLPAINIVRRILRVHIYPGPIRLPGPYGTTYDMDVIRQITVDEWNGQPRINIFVEAAYRNPSNLGVIRLQTEQALGIAVFNVPTLQQQLDCHQWSMGDSDWNLEAAHPSNPGWGHPRELERNFTDFGFPSGACNWSE